MAVAETQNCLITVLSGTTVNQFGDEIDANAPRIEHMPATLIETGHTTQDPSTPTPRTIREVLLHVPQWARVSDSDRVLDETTGDIYIVISVTRPPTLIGAPVDEVCSLKRVTANST